MTEHQNQDRPPLDLVSLWTQVVQIQKFCNEKIQKRETDPAEEPKEIE